jgi:hypothetical protein
MNAFSSKELNLMREVQNLALPTNHQSIGASSKTGTPVHGVPRVFNSCLAGLSSIGVSRPSVNRVMQALAWL